MSRAYYNEHDRNAAAWLRELIKEGAIADGDVDERSIAAVRPDDLVGYDQCHFFAGIGGWSLALRLAGWPDDRRVWTGSCPCQPYSSAGKGKGNADDRNLWPVFFGLIRECEPDIVFGEQVEGAIGYGWLDGVSADLEAEDYAVGSIVLGSHSVGSPNIRQRLYWLADSSGPKCNGRGEPKRKRRQPFHPSDRCEVSWLDNSISVRRNEHQYPRDVGREAVKEPQHGREVIGEGSFCPSPVGGLGDAIGEGPQGLRSGIGGEPGHGGYGRAASSPGPWGEYDIIRCRDGKSRRVESGSFPLVAGLPRGVVPCRDPGITIDANDTAEARVMRLKGYGNAINPYVAAEFIETFMEVAA